jgi:AraC-like DNA-binding protein
LHFRDRVSVKGYAELLGVTRARLNDACVRVAGSPPQAMLHARLIDEARRRLDQSGLSVEQVAYSLGFRDPAYFNRFFTRLTGLTPGEFKKAAREAKIAEESSFAAWP